MKLINLTKKYGKKIVLDNFSLSLKDNGIIALKGASGSGKTTVLRIISGLDKKHSGSIEYEGISKISYVFQEPRLLPHSTVLENVSIPLGNTDEAKAVAAKHLTALGLENELHSYPDQLSGGMKQRVAIARAFAYDGDILLLDEALNGLDEKNCRIVLDKVLEYSRSKPCIFVSHNDAHTDYLGAEVVYV